MASALEERSDAAEEIEDLCIALFDRWCERRCMVPLAYLMHTWPIAGASPQLIDRLTSTLRDLVIYHADTLDAEDRALIGRVIAIATGAS
ncbi:hypothetical protein [Paraburkholderia phenazinium]|jgi:hypothetical protein|uniref:Uncharacterized protein n=1 Tax=Paraburkholderia phenazinium TaxID=60549 RepID=A0A1G7U6R6_9BURK|nr:hypothetical protein [Paraburkholderia phenazinium]SDG43097.1 hypothetical protein SAMN05216466_103323 [Paraburkholderia phenazinium]